LRNGGLSTGFRDFLEPLGSHLLLRRSQSSSSQKPLTEIECLSEDAGSSPLGDVSTDMSDDQLDTGRDAVDGLPWNGYGLTLRPPVWTTISATPVEEPATAAPSP